MEVERVIRHLEEILVEIALDPIGPEKLAMVAHAHMCLGALRWARGDDDDNMPFIAFVKKVERAEADAVKRKVHLVQ